MKRIFTFAAIFLSALSAKAQDFSGPLTVAPFWNASQTNGSAVSTIAVGTILSQAHTYGTNANQMNGIALRSGTLTNGQTLDVDLSLMTNAFGAVNFARVNFLAVRSPTNNAWLGTGTNATMTGTNLLVVGNAAATQFDSWLNASNAAVALKPGGLLLLTSPISGYASASKILRLSHVGDTNSITYELYVAGQQ